MMQAPESQHGDHFAARVHTACCLAACRSLLAQAQMRPVLMVIADILVHHPLQMTFVEDDDVIEQVSAAAANPALRDAALLRAFERRANWFCSKDSYCIHKAAIEDGIPVEDQILRRRVVWKGFSQLVHYPRARRMPSEIATDDTPPLMCNH